MTYEQPGRRPYLQSCSKRTMKVLDLFSGIGGFSLGLERAGMETVAFCEIEGYPRKVLAKHWPNIPIYDDVRTLTKERLDDDGIGSIDVICGGYPCQPYSKAGKRKGQDDDRHLWPEVDRLIQEYRPSWFIGENVFDHITLGLDNVLSDLERSGYSWETFVIPACAVNAPHRRDRVWIVANIGSERVEGRSEAKISRERSIPRIKNVRGIKDLPERSSVYKSRLCGPGHGIPSWMDRLKGLGNAVVPQIPEIIGRAIMNITV